MGMEYCLYCEDCDEKTEGIEFSIIDRIEFKFKTLETLEKVGESWVNFLIGHSGHKIKFVDSKGRETDPTEISPGYVLGINEEAFCE